MTKATRVLNAVQGEIWAIDRDKLQQITAVVARRFSGEPKLTADEVAAIQRPKTPTSRAGAVAVLPLHGVVAQRMDMMTAMSGGTSTEQFARAFDELVADDAVSAIVIDVHSPGGSVSGVPELAARIRAARGTKPIIAVANSLMCSAAYWIASAADEIVATEMAFVGSCNAIMVRADMTAADEKEGIKYHFITGGETNNKAEGDPHFPASKEELAHLQANVDVAYDRFFADVAANRGISIEQAHDRFGEGRAFIGPRALEAKIVDRIGTLDSVVNELLGGKPGARRPLRAETIGYIAVGDVQPIAAELTVTAGTGAAVLQLVPAHQPAPEARSEPMPNETGTAATVQPGAANDLLAQERKRVEEIRGLGRDHKIDDAKVGAWIASGVSVEAVSGEILNVIRERASTSAQVAPGATREHQKPFASFGEQLQAVIVAGGMSIPGVDKAVAVGRLAEVQAAATGHSATVGAEGGFMVGTQVEQGLMKRAYDQSVLASRCSTTPIGANADGLETLAIKESSRATGSRYGGVRFYRVAEAETVTASKLGLEKFELRLEDLMAVTYLTERLMQDAPALQAEVEEAFASEGAFVIDDEIYRGSGAGQCLGIINAPSLVTVSAEDSQVADTIVAENLWKMWARVWNRSRGNGVFVYNQALDPQFPQLSVKIKNVAGAENVGGFNAPIWTPAGANGSPTATLFGRPLIPIEQASAPGDVGDIAFFDGSQYKLINKGGVKVDESMHVRFLYNERALRFTFRVNGKPKWSTALTPYKGADTLSPFVTLAAR